MTLDTFCFFAILAAIPVVSILLVVVLIPFTQELGAELSVVLKSETARAELFALLNGGSGRTVFPTNEPEPVPAQPQNYRARIRSVKDLLIPGIVTIVLIMIALIWWDSHSAWPFDRSFGLVCGDDRLHQLVLSLDGYVHKLEKQAESNGQSHGRFGAIVCDRYCEIADNMKSNPFMAVVSRIVSVPAGGMRKGFTAYHIQISRGGDLTFSKRESTACQFNFEAQKSVGRALCSSSNLEYSYTCPESLSLSPPNEDAWLTPAVAIYDMGLPDYEAVKLTDHMPVSLHLAQPKLNHVYIVHCLNSGGKDLWVKMLILKMSEKEWIVFRWDVLNRDSKAG